MLCKSVLCQKFIQQAASYTQIQEEKLFFFFLGYQVPQINRFSECKNNYLSKMRNNLCLPKVLSGKKIVCTRG